MYVCVGCAIVPTELFSHLVRILSCQNVAAIISGNNPATYYNKEDWILELESPLQLYTGMCSCVCVCVCECVCVCVCVC